MKRILLVFIITALSLQIKAQTALSLPDTGRIYTKVDIIPEFPGGFTKFDNYVDINSVMLLKSGHALGIVIAEVLIERNGKVTRPKIIKSLSPATDSATIYLLRNSPLWQPGTKNGVVVRTDIRVAVKFNGVSHAPVHTTDIKITNPRDADVAIDAPISNDAVERDDNKIFTVVEIMPSFVGGYDKFNAYIEQNLRWPPNAEKVSSWVIASFVVEKDGNLDDIHILRAATPEMNAEAIRLIKNSPKWKPGTQGGRPVRVASKVSVVFDAGD